MKNWTATKSKLTIAAIGDSVTAGFPISSDLDMFLRMWIAKKRSWFSDVTERISQKIPVVSCNYSSAGSKVSSRVFGLVLDRLCHINDMADQVDELLVSSVFPDLILIGMGHNDLNWPPHREKDFATVTREFREVFRTQLERLAEKAIRQNRKIAIVVFGFINIHVLFQLREKAALEKKQNPNLFPYFEKGYKMFPAIKPEHKEKTIALAGQMDEAMAEEVNLCQKKYKNDNLRIVYSDAWSQTETVSLANVTAIDGWHPSEKGQKRLADAAWPVIEKALKFVRSSAQ